jgi:L-cysteine S-thiosulfotransferase
MMTTKWMLGAGLAALVLSPMALAEPSYDEVQQIIKRDFKPKGQAKMDRLDQDVVQRVCTQSMDKPPADVAKAIEADQLAMIPFPSGSLMGNWKSGAKIAWSGRGMQWNEDPKKPAGGGCYNCHEISAQRTSFGTIGPSLKAFGKKRGSGSDMQRYVYGKIYNAKAYSLCTQMPRFGMTGTLTEQQIKDLVAYVLSPESPNNK